MLFQNPELATRYQWGRDHHTGGVVSGAAGVVAYPHRGIAEGSVGFRIGVEVGPQHKVRVTTLQVCQVERALSAVDELAQVKLVEHFIRVLKTQLLQIEQVTAAGNGVINSDDLAPLPVRAEHALAQLRLARKRQAGLLVLATLEGIAGPEWIGLVTDGAGG